MNLVDVSKETIDRRWDSLLSTFNIDPKTMVEAVAAGDEATIMPQEQAEAIAAEDLENARNETRATVRPLMEKPMRFLFEKRFPEWEVTDDEINDLCEIYSELFAKHFPFFYQNPYVQRVRAFVEDLELEIKAVYRTYEFVKKRKKVLEQKAKEAGDKENSQEQKQDSTTDNKPEQTGHEHHEPGKIKL